MDQNILLLFRLLGSVCAIVLGLSALCTVALAQNGQPQVWEKSAVYMENVPREAWSLGKTISEHLPTERNFSFRGYSLNNKDAYFSEGGEIYKYNGGRRQPRLVLDKDWSLNGADIVSVCGKEGFITRRDNDGNEYHTLYLSTLKGKKRETLTKGRARRLTLTYPNARDRIAYVSSPEESGVWHVEAHSLCEDKSSKRLASYNDTARLLDWSPDGQHLLVGVQGPEKFRLEMVNTETGERSTVHESSAALSHALFAKTGTAVFFTTSALSNVNAVYLKDLRSGQIDDLTSGVGLDVDGIVLSDDRTRMAVAFNWNGLNRVMVLDAINIRDLNLGIDRSPGVISKISFSPDNKKLIMTVSQPAIPSSTIVYDMESQKLARWFGGLKRNGEVELLPKFITYPTFDEVDGAPRRIPALVYLPPDLQPGEKRPVIINAHGGPASQHRPGFNRIIHYYVTQLGAVVIEPNIRGSSGYGRHYESLDDREKREDSIKDIGALLDWISEQSALDSDRVVIIGGSYGGYVVLSSLVHYSDRLKGGISRVGISDFETFLQNTERNRVKNRRREYGDERDPAMKAIFDQISPLKNANKITAPLLIIQGANDPRVPATQAEMIRDAVRANGTEVWFLLSKEHGHSINSGDARRLSRGAQLSFLKKMLFGS